MLNQSPLHAEDKEFLLKICTLFREAKLSTKTPGHVGFLVTEAERAVILQQLENIALYGDSTAEMYGGAV